MAVAISIVFIEGNTVETAKTYQPLIHDATCSELRTLAENLNLKRLAYLHYTESCIFNNSQCQEIIHVEISVLRAQNLSTRAQIALDSIECAIKDIDDPRAFLLFEGD